MFPGWRTKIPHAMQHGKKKKKKYLNSHYTCVKMLNLISNKEMLITARVRFHYLAPEWLKLNRPTGSVILVLTRI